MNPIRVAKTLFMAYALCGFMPTLAETSEVEVSGINRRMRLKNGFSGAVSLMVNTTPRMAKSTKTFATYLESVGNGVKSALKDRDIDFSDVLGIAMIANHLDSWARAIPDGMPHYTRFVEDLADASKSARPASIGGKLGSQMQLILFTLAIENKDIVKAETARKAALSMSSYDGDDGFASFCIPIIDVAFTLISKDTTAALSRYQEQHKKLADKGLADMEELLWSILAVLEDKGTDLGKLEPVKKDLDAKFCKGVKIRKVFPDTAANKAGWRNGDRIVAIDGKTVLYNSDDGGRQHLEAILTWRRTTPNRRPTTFKLKRGETFLTSQISDDSLGIEF